MRAPQSFPQKLWKVVVSKKLSFLLVPFRDNLKRAAEFYDAIAKEMGVGRIMESDTFIAWGALGGAAGGTARRDAPTRGGDDHQ